MAFLIGVFFHDEYPQSQKTCKCVLKCVLFGDMDTQVTVHEVYTTYQMYEKDLDTWRHLNVDHLVTTYTLEDSVSYYAKGPECAICHPLVTLVGRRDETSRRLWGSW